MWAAWSMQLTRWTARLHWAPHSYPPRSSSWSLKQLRSTWSGSDPSEGPGGPLSAGGLGTAGSLGGPSTAWRPSRRPGGLSRERWHLKAAQADPCSFPHSLPRQVGKTGPPPAPPAPPRAHGCPSPGPGSALPTSLLPDLRPCLLGHRHPRRGVTSTCHQVPVEAVPSFPGAQMSRLPGSWAWREICWGQKPPQSYYVPGWHGAPPSPRVQTPPPSKGPWQDTPRGHPESWQSAVHVHKLPKLQTVVTVPEG